MDKDKCPVCGHDTDGHIGYMDADGLEMVGCHQCECDLSASAIKLIDEARAYAFKMYRERNEIYRDLVDAENEIKRLRKMVMERQMTDGCKAIPLIDDGIGAACLAWCTDCGGDMQVVRPGLFVCGECGK